MERVRSRAAISVALDVLTPAVSYSCGAVGEREERIAREAGYVAGFGIARGWGGSELSTARTPADLWAQMVPVSRRLRAPARLAGYVANS